MGRIRSSCDASERKDTVGRERRRFVLYFLKNHFHGVLF